jgi:hypothetical protein
MEKVGPVGNFRNEEKANFFPDSYYRYIIRRAVVKYLNKNNLF